MRLNGGSYTVSLLHVSQHTSADLKIAKIQAISSTDSVPTIHACLLGTCTFTI